MNSPEASTATEPALVLGPMLRHVDSTSATVWVETSTPGTVEILDHSTRTFSVYGHHYAVVIVDGLEPASITPYSVRLEGRVVWPLADDPFPDPVIRTHTSDLEPRIIFGSCRAAAPHERPFTQELVFDAEGRGVDALWAYATALLDRSVDQWPDLLILAGDQIYADDSSPMARERIERRRDHELPPEIVADFEEYTWLYREAWQPAVERWLFSVIPTVMIFDDHDMIDDWNISAAWVTDIRREPWWENHVVGGIASYLVYQHLGNLSPAELVDDGLLAELVTTADATEVLRRWAEQSEEHTPVPGGYEFNFSRDVGRTRVVVVDCRNGRVLGDDRRAMLDDDALQWLRDRCHEPTHHLVIVTSVPVFIHGGLHDLQLWNERVCAGAWGRRAARVGERIRRGLDLEDWAAFSRSYHQIVSLFVDITTGHDPTPVTVISGDIHFAYAADVRIPGVEHGAPLRQVVSSPLRNALIPPERGVMRFMLTRTAARLGRVLARSVRRRSTAPGLTVTRGPVFGNNIGELVMEADDLAFTLHVASMDGERPQLTSDVSPPSGRGG